MPHPNTDPFAPVTRAELHAELADIRDTLARFEGRLEQFATKEYVGTQLEPLATKEYVGAQLEPLATKEYVRAQLEPLATKEFVGMQLEHVATKEYVLKGVLGIVGVFVALLSVAVGIILRFG